MLAQYHLAPRDADGLGAHDFICQAVGHYAVLMDAGLVGESVSAEDGLVGLYLQAYDGLQQSGAPVDARRIHPAGQFQRVPPRAQAHDDLFQRSVARPFPDPAQRYLRLPRPGGKAGQRIGDCHAQIVMRVDGDRHAFEPGTIL
jgi:hypothetical protein